MLGFYSLRSDAKVSKFVQPGIVEEELKPISKKNAFADAVGVFAGTCCSTELLRGLQCQRAASMDIPQPLNFLLCKFTCWLSLRVHVPE